MIDSRGDDVARRWSLRLLAVLLAGGVVLSGCADKQEANDSLPTPSATPTEAELPPLGPDDLPMPDEARTQDAAGAEAFVRYYIELINRQKKVLDGAPLRELGPECDDCLRIAQRLDEVRATGGRIEGGQLSLAGEPGITISGQTAEVSFIASVEAVAVFDATDRLVPDTSYGAEERLPSGIGLEWSTVLKSWLVDGLTIG